MNKEQITKRIDGYDSCLDISCLKIECWRRQLEFYSKLTKREILSKLRKLDEYKLNSIPQLTSAWVYVSKTSNKNSVAFSLAKGTWIPSGTPPTCDILSPVFENQLNIVLNIFDVK